MEFIYMKSYLLKSNSEDLCDNADTYYFSLSIVEAISFVLGKLKSVFLKQFLLCTFTI